MPTPRRFPPQAGRVAILVCAALLASCGPDKPQGDTPEAVPNASREGSTLPVAEPPLDRERLLLAAFRAASAFAAGADDSAAQRQLDGKRFELRFRFGCGEADSQDDSRGWRFDESERTLRLRVTSDLSERDPAVAQIASKEFEGVEGLWLRRPWLLPATCPRKPAASPTAEQASPVAEEVGREVEDATAPAATPGGRRVGVAQFFTATDPRTARRRQRPFEVTKVLEEGQGPSAQGYDFIMSGRLRALPDRRVIVCSVGGPDLPPDCIVSVHVDRSWIERPDTKELIAEWSGS